MKVKHSILLILFGMGLEFFGMLFKIQHYPFATEINFIGTGVKAIASLLLLYKAFTFPKIKEFLNW